MRTRIVGKLVAFTAAMAMIAASCAGEDGDPPDDTGGDSPEETAGTTEETPGSTETTAAEGLTLGYLLPETGPAANLGPTLIKSVELAVSEVNDAGGVLGVPVELMGADNAGDAGVAAEEASRLIASGIDAMVGAALTSMTMAVIDQVTNAGVVMCSPSNTGPNLTTYPDDGFYFRTAPSDALQGPVIADRIIADGHETLAIAARSDDYGKGLLEAAQAAFEARGGEVVYAETYDQQASTFDSVVEGLVSSDADAMLLILVTLGEAPAILQGLLAEGVDLNNAYGDNGLSGPEFNESVDPNDPNVLDGLRVTTPANTFTGDFDQKLTDFAPEITERLFGAQSYDCANIIMLAAAAAGSSDSESIKSEMNAVTNGQNACDSFPECVEFLEAGETIAYQSAAGGPLNFTEAGEPSRGCFDINQWIDGEVQFLEEVCATTP